MEAAMEAAKGHGGQLFGYGGAGKGYSAPSYSAHGDRPIPAVLVPTPVLLTAHLVLTKDLHTVDLHTVEPTKQSYPISLPKMSRLSFDQMHMAIFI